MIEGGLKLLLYDCFSTIKQQMEVPNAISVCQRFSYNNVYKTYQYQVRIPNYDFESGILPTFWNRVRRTVKKVQRHSESRLI